MLLDGHRDAYYNKRCMIINIYPDCMDKVLEITNLLVDNYIEYVVRRLAYNNDEGVSIKTEPVEFKRQKELRRHIQKYFGIPMYEM